MAQTIAGIQLEAITKGPLLGRLFPDITNECVVLIAKNWMALTGPTTEKKWAKKYIQDKVATAFPVVYAWLIKFLVVLLIKWFAIKNRRNSKFNDEMKTIQSYL